MGQTPYMTRFQIPLELSFASTINKIQSRTEEAIILDCKCVFNPGQISVGISRVRDSSRLAVLNFHPKKCLSPRREVLEMLAQDKTALDENLACCRGKQVPPIYKPNTKFNNSHVEEDESMDEDECLDDSEEIESMLKELSEEEFARMEWKESYVECVNDIELKSEKLQELVESMYKGHIMESSYQKEMEAAVKEMQNDASALKRFSTFVTNTTAQLWEKECPNWRKQTTATKNQTQFVGRWFAFLQSKEFKNAVKVLFHTHQPTVSQQHVAKDLSMKIKTEVIHQVASVLRKEKGQVSELPQEITNHTEAGKKVIRKLAGRAVAKTRKAYLKFSRSAIKRGNCDEKAEKALDILRHLEESFNTLKETSCQPRTLEAVERSQGITRGLTHVTDAMFMWALTIDQKRKEFQHRHLKDYKGDILTETVNHIKSNSEVWEMWKEMQVTSENVCDYITLLSAEENENIMFRELSKQKFTCAEISKEVYDKLIDSLLRVSNNGFRKYVLEHVANRKKQIQHRHAVLVESDTTVEPTNKKNDTAKFSMQKSIEHEERGSEETDTSSVIVEEVEMNTVDEQEETDMETVVGDEKEEVEGNIENEVQSMEIEKTECVRKKEKHLEKRRVLVPVRYQNGASNIEDVDETDEACIICSVLESNTPCGWRWIQCSQCQSWIHIKCLNLTTKEVRKIQRSPSYICCKCKDTAYSC